MFLLSGWLVSKCSDLYGDVMYINSHVNILVKRQHRDVLAVYLLALNVTVISTLHNMVYIYIYIR
jgi:hypothetical protein